MGCRMLCDRSTHCGKAWGGVFDVVALGQNDLIVDAGLVEEFEHGFVRSLEPMTRVNEEVNPREIRASACRPVSALMRLDLPTLERPAKATSMPCMGGSESMDAAAPANRHSPANSLRPAAISACVKDGRIPPRIGRPGQAR